MGYVRILNTPNAEQLQGRAAEREGIGEGGDGDEVKVGSGVMRAAK